MSDQSGFEYDGGVVYERHGNGRQAIGAVWSDRGDGHPATGFERLDENTPDRLGRYGERELHHLGMFSDEAEAAAAVWDWHHGGGFNREDTT